MKIYSTFIPGLKLISVKRTEDIRGGFVKYFSRDEYREFYDGSPFCESFYSTSKTGVIRGMHLQLPPFDHDKLVHVISGSVLDVVVDLRKDSHTKGQCYRHVLHEPGHNDLDVSTMFIPRGMAHGFLALTPYTLMHYSVTSPYSPEYDTGIRYDSFGFNWEEYGVKNPVISERDLNLSKELFFV